MGKKVKPSSLLDSSSIRQEVSQEQKAFEDASLVGNGPMTSEAKEKLEKYDALEKSVGALSKEKEVLEAKLAEYADRLAELQTAADQISELNEENEKLKKELADAKDESKEVYALKKEIEAQKDEINNYLVRISELTFENANLACQLDKLSKKMASSGSVHNQTQFSPNVAPPVQGKLRQPRTDAFNPYMNNGYGVWS